ncbi:hypothetical protein HELRODRAFT_172700 [Helobdella robusta]|uniref:Uncharacterized protein n=1 Tax=Helobdella robusta TaxID=6412 RepID=T1F5T5_HELRO|nr:hypothetical protein HELRODRAFT_172700 [Helobdella robusta]ESO04338.1 hypothetical protein HELRODRAFT_172700 [Helobdella robusta]
MWRATNGDVVAFDRHWIAPCLNRSVDRWLQLNSSTFDKARIMAVKSELGSTWLRALPNTSCGTRLDDSCVRVSLDLRLEAQIVTEYECACGARPAIIIRPYNTPHVSEPKFKRQLLTRCLICYKHFCSRPDGTLVIHGGKTKCSELAGSLMKPLAANKRKLLGNHLVNVLAKIAVSPSGPKVNLADNFFRKSANFKLYDHIPKHTRLKFGQLLCKQLKEIWEKPNLQIVWFRLLFLPVIILRKSLRGGKRHSPVTIVNQKIDEFFNCPVEKMAEYLEPIINIGKVKSSKSKASSPPKKRLGCFGYILTNFCMLEMLEVVSKRHFGWQRRPNPQTFERCDFFKKRFMILWISSMALPPSLICL